MCIMFGATTSVKISHFPSGDQSGANTFRFPWNCSTAFALPSARFVRRSKAVAPDPDSNVTDCPSGVQSALIFPFPSRVRLTAGSPPSCFVQMSARHFVVSTNCDCANLTLPVRQHLWPCVIDLSFGGVQRGKPLRDRASFGLNTQKTSLPLTVDVNESVASP